MMTPAAIEFGPPLDTEEAAAMGNSRWPVVRMHTDRVVAAIMAAKPGTYTEVEIPD